MQISLALVIYLIYTLLFPWMDWLRAISSHSGKLWRKLSCVAGECQIRVRFLIYFFYFLNPLGVYLRLKLFRYPYTPLFNKAPFDLRLTNFQFDGNLDTELAYWYHDESNASLVHFKLRQTKKAEDAIIQLSFARQSLLNFVPSSFHAILASNQPWRCYMKLIKLRVKQYVGVKLSFLWPSFFFIEHDFGIRSSPL